MISNFEQQKRHRLTVEGVYPAYQLTNRVKVHIPCICSIAEVCDPYTR
jgi:hypothetical protein